MKSTRSPCLFAEEMVQLRSWALLTSSGQTQMRKASAPRAIPPKPQLPLPDRDHPAKPALLRPHPEVRLVLLPITLPQVVRGLIKCRASSERPVRLYLHHDDFRPHDDFRGNDHDECHDHHHHKKHLDDFRTRDDRRGKHDSNDRGRDNNHGSASPDDPSTATFTNIGTDADLSYQAVTAASRKASFFPLPPPKHLHLHLKSPRSHPKTGQDRPVGILRLPRRPRPRSCSWES